MKKPILICFTILITGQFSYAQWTTSGNNIYYNSGNIGIGTSSPTTPLHISQAAAGTTVSYIRLDGQASAPSLYLNVGSDGNHNGVPIAVTAFGRQGGGEDLRFETWNWAGEYTWGYHSASGGTKVVADIGTSGYGFSGVNDYGRFTLYSVSDAQGGYNSSGRPLGAALINIDANSNNTTYFNAGNVAIGTTNAQGYKLAVNGTAIATSLTVKLYANWPDYVFTPSYSLPSLTSLKTYIDQNHHLPGIPTDAEVYKTGLNLGEMDETLVKKVEELTLYLIDKDKEIETLREQQKQALDDKKDIKSQLTLMKNMILIQQQQIKKLESQIDKLSNK